MTVMCHLSLLLARIDQPIIEHATSAIVRQGVRGLFRTRATFDHVGHHHRTFSILYDTRRTLEALKQETEILKEQYYNILY